MTEVWSHLLFAFCLCLSRISAMLASAPAIASSELAGTAKVFVSAALSLSVALSCGAAIALPHSPVEVIVACAREAGVGLLLGIFVQLVFEAVRLAGQICGMQLGLSLASLLDPISQQESTVLSALLENAALALFFCVSGPERLLAAAAFGLGGNYAAASSSTVLMPALRLVERSAYAALCLALPVITITLFFELIVAFLARLAPQLPVLPAGATLKSLAGMLALTAGLSHWTPRLTLLFHDALTPRLP